MAEPSREQFVREMTQLHRPLYAYIFSLVSSIEAADDLLQETNLRLWHKIEANEPIKNFRALAYELARFQVLTYRKQLHREKLRFGDDVFEQLAAATPPGDDQWETMRVAVRHCLGELPEHSRNLLDQRYAEGGSVQAIARESGRSEAAISQSLYRIRNLLATCIKQFMVAEEQA